MKLLISTLQIIRGKFSARARISLVAIQLLTISSLLTPLGRAADIVEGDTPSMINSKCAIEFSHYSKKMSDRLMTWSDYTVERRFYRLLQVQVNYANKTAFRLSGIEAVFSLVTEKQQRLYAMRQMYMHYKDAYADLETYWELTDKVTKMRPELISTTSKEIQELTSTYALEWVKIRRDAFKAELKKIDADFKE